MKLIIIPTINKNNINHPHHAIEALPVSGNTIPIESIIPIKLPAITRRKIKFNIGSLSLNHKKFTTKLLKRVFIFHHSKNNILMKTIIIDLKKVLQINQKYSTCLVQPVTGLIFAIGQITRAIAKIIRNIVKIF
jgi:hypothetical protein